MKIKLVILADTESTDNISNIAFDIEAILDKHCTSYNVGLVVNPMIQQIACKNAEELDSSNK